MAAPVEPLRLEIRIPNLPTGKMVDGDGNPTDDELTFRQILTTNLQKYFGNEGVVHPTLTTAEILEVAAHQETNPGGTFYTCQYGTQVYNSTANSVMIAVNNGSNAPIFKTVTLT